MDNIQYGGYMLSVKTSGGSDGQIIDLVDEIIGSAVKQQASDIHIEPLDDCLRIRYRIDGMLQTEEELPLEKHPAIVSRIKIISGMDIAEKRIPQDGRMEIELQQGVVDLRISTLPTMRGEKVVIRILDRSCNLLSAERLGMSATNYRLFRRLYSLPHGMVLVTGPTGSGKSTTLYAALNAVNTEEKNIITIEDPIEYKLIGINQVAVNNKAGLTFASGLRAIVRQDPNIIMVGEIRDTETARIAVQAAMTGHLVFSTLHTNSAAGAVTRLIDMGIESFLLAATLRGIIAQRLVRRICPNCREQYILSAAEQSLLKTNSEQACHGSGCEQCRYTGYRGRIAVHEILVCDDEMRKAILAGADEAEIAATGYQNGSKSLAEDGINKVLEGITTVDELMKAIYL